MVFFYLNVKTKQDFENNCDSLTAERKYIFYYYRNAIKIEKKTLDFSQSAFPPTISKRKRKIQDTIVYLFSAETLSKNDGYGKRVLEHGRWSNSGCSQLSHNESWKASQSCFTLAFTIPTHAPLQKKRKRKSVAAPLSAEIFNFHAFFSFLHHLILCL